MHVGNEIGFSSEEQSLFLIWACENPKELVKITFIFQNVLNFLAQTKRINVNRIVEI